MMKKLVVIGFLGLVGGQLIGMDEVVRGDAEVVSNDSSNGLTPPARPLDDDQKVYSCESCKHSYYEALRIRRLNPNFFRGPSEIFSVIGTEVHLLHLMTLVEKDADRRDLDGHLELLRNGVHEDLAMHVEGIKEIGFDHKDSFRIIARLFTHCISQLLETLLRPPMVDREDYQQVRMPFTTTALTSFVYKPRSATRN